MKHYLPCFLILFYSLTYAHTTIIPITSQTTQNTIDRKLSEKEVKQRGLDLLATEIIEQINEVDLRKMARSSIFETSYGFRWKMVNVQNGTIIIVKVNKDFKLISAKNSKKKKIIIP